jgi:hypothetical protein
MNEEDITGGIKDILASSVSRGGDARSAAESAGMRRDSVPSTTCNYVGKAIYRFGGLPKDSEHRNRQTIITVYIKLSSYTDLNSLIVRKEEIEVQTE